MSQANVHSVDALKDFKLTMVNFSEDARNALSSVEMEIRQTRNWLERDQLSYWKAQVKKCQEMVMQARSELHRRQLSQQNSDSVSDADQKEALRLAQKRLREAEEKVERIKKWVPVLEHAIAEYHSQSQPLGDRLSGQLVESFAVLDRMITALENYMALTAPSAPVIAPAGGGPDQAASPAKGGTASASTSSESVEEAPAQPASGDASSTGDGASANGEAVDQGRPRETAPLASS